MRIVHVLNEVVDAGNGIVNATVDLACAQAGAGHDVFVVSSGGGFIGLLESHGIAHHTVCLRPRTLGRMLKDLPRLRRVVRALQPDIVHAHMMTGALLAWLGRTFAGFGTFGLVTTIHNEWRTTSRLMSVGDRVVVLSNNGKKVFTQRGIPECKLRVVSHGVLNSPRRYVNAGGAYEELTVEPRNVNPVIVTVAGLYTRKGVGDLIQSFSRIASEFPKATLKIAGSGPDEQSLRDLGQSVFGSDRIEFLGFVARPYLLLQHTDIFVLASHTEAFPLALVEARESGCAVIGTTVGGVPELLENGRAGLLVAPHDIDGLTRTLRRLLANPEELSYWRKAARHNLNWLTSARMERETMDVYLSLANLPENAPVAACRLKDRTLAAVADRLLTATSKRWRSRR